MHAFFQRIQYDDMHNKMKMHLLISFNHDVSFTQERREEGRCLSENLCGCTLCIYRVEKRNHTLQHCYYCSPVPDKQTPIEYGTMVMFLSKEN